MTHAIRNAVLVLLSLTAAPLLAAAPSVDCERRPASLRGTAVDGSLSVDARGRFVPTAGARLLFDYFLTATGEEPVEAIRTRVVAEVASRLPEPAASEAVAAFDLYLAYLDRAKDLAPVRRMLDDEGGLALLSDLRRDVLGRDAAAAYFGEEEEADRAALRRRALGLSSRPAGESDGAIAVPEARVARERLFGTAAADRLEALDRTRAAWRARVEAFRAAKAALAARERDPERRAAQVEELLSLSFSAPERLRVEALERIEAR